MTKDEAFELSRETGVKIRHRYFSDNESMVVDRNVLLFEDGVKCTIHEFFRWRTDAASWNDDWSIVN